MVEVKKLANSLVSVQRTAALRIALAYSTVSALAVLVIVVTIPVEVLAQRGWSFIRRNRLEITQSFTSGKISK